MSIARKLAASLASKSVPPPRSSGEAAESCEALNELDTRMALLTKLLWIGA